jgi:hypothetical protein
MEKNLDEKLRAALRPVDPDGDFANDVLARIDPNERHSAKNLTLPRRPLRWHIPVALAASVACTILVGLEWRQQQQEGLRAREQLIEALRVTSSKLDLVHDIVEERSRADDARENGA